MNTLDFKIRKMEDRDLAEVISLENEALTSFFKDLQTKDKSYLNPFARLKVATTRDEAGNELVIGFIHYWITFDSATITQIAVNSKFKRKGVAQALLKEMNDDCLFNNVRSITLEVKTGNVAAISLYEKDGFKNITIKEHYYEDGTDAFYMVKEVN